MRNLIRLLVQIIILQRDRSAGDGGSLRLLLSHLFEPRVQAQIASKVSPWTIEAMQNVMAL